MQRDTSASPSQIRTGRRGSAEVSYRCRVRSGFEGLVAYCSAYETNEAKHCVIHHVEADREPAVMGTNRTRLASADGHAARPRPLDLPAGLAEWTVEFERVCGGMPAPRHP